MSLADDLEAAIAERLNPCPVCTMLAGLKSADREAVQAALASKIGRNRLALILKSHGHEVTPHWIYRHRTEAHQP